MKNITLQFSIFLVSCFLLGGCQGLFDVHGVVVPVFTPFTKDGRINFGVMPLYLKYLQDHGISIISVGSLSGEMLSLSQNEKKEVLEAFSEVAKTLNMKVLATIGDGSLPDALDMAAKAQDLSVAAITVLPQTIVKPKSEDELVLYLKRISESAPKVPILYYHEPKSTGVAVNIRKVFTKATATIPNFKGIKTNILDAAEVADLIVGDQNVYVVDYLFSPVIDLGLDSVSNPVSNIFPRSSIVALEAMKAGDVSTAVDIQLQITRAVHAIADGGDYKATMKYATELLTRLPIGPTRFPTPPVTEQGKLLIRQNLGSMGLLNNA